MTEGSVIASAVSPQGRNVELTKERWRYIQRHVEMRERQENADRFVTAFGQDNDPEGLLR